MPDRVVAVIWSDWSHYHVARYRAIATCQHPGLHFAGIELLGGPGRHGNPFRDTNRDGLEIETLFHGQGWSEVSGIRIAAALWYALSRLNASVVLVPGYYTLPMLAAVCWAIAKRRKAILLTESTAGDHQRNRLLEQIKGRVLRCVFSRAVVGGKRSERYMKALGFGADMLGRFYDVVDNDYFRAGTERLQGSEGADGRPHRYFLFVGRLVPEKNLTSLIRAFAEYRQAGGDWSLVIVGSGPLLPELQAEAAAWGVSAAVDFRGFQTAAGLLPLYAFAATFVLPSLREPWGLVVNEAMAAGLPVIVSTRCGCSEDLVRDGLNGYLFDPDVPGALVGCLCKVAALDSEKQASMARTSREIIAEYSLEAWASEVQRGCGAVIRIARQSE